MKDPQAASSTGNAFELSHLLRSSSESSPLPLIVVEGATHVVRYLNNAFALLAGKTPAKLIGRPLAEAVPEGESNDCLAMVDQVFRTGTPTVLAEQPHAQAASLAYWTYSAWPILGRYGCPVGVFINVTDVTETAVFRRQVTEMNQALILSIVRQQELTETANQLSSAVLASEGRYRRLLETAHAQAADLAELQVRKDEYLAMVSHELRNPLAAIVNTVYVLRRKPNDALFQQKAGILIENQVKQLNRFIDDLTEIFRITTGRIRLRLEKIVVNDVVERAVESVRPLMEKHRHQLTLSLSHAPIRMEADPDRLEQVIVNLLLNSAKYTSNAGQIVLSVEEVGRDGQLPDEVVLRIRDNGMGITPELLPCVFDLFIQAQQSLDHSEGGLGIGLALVKYVVELHHGRVKVHSSLGHGSEFVVHLPLNPPTASPVAPNHDAPERP